MSHLKNAGKWESAYFQEWSFEDILVVFCRHYGLLKTFWSFADSMVFCRLYGLLKTLWSFADFPVAFCGLFSSTYVMSTYYIDRYGYL